MRNPVMSADDAGMETPITCIECRRDVRDGHDELCEMPAVAILLAMAELERKEAER